MTFLQWNFLTSKWSTLLKVQLHYHNFYVWVPFSSIVLGFLNPTLQLNRTDVTTFYMQLENPVHQTRTPPKIRSNLTILQTPSNIAHHLRTPQHTIITMHSPMHCALHHPCTFPCTYSCMAQLAHQEIPQSPYRHYTILLLPYQGFLFQICGRSSIYNLLVSIGHTKICLRMMKIGLF